MGTLLTPENQEVIAYAVAHADLFTQIACSKPGNPHWKGMCQSLDGP